MNNYKLILSIIGLIIYSANINAQNLEQEQDKINIVGTWVSEEDSLWTMIFTNDEKCIQKYDYEEVEDEVYTYILSNTSPQCGREVPVTDLSNYLMLKTLDNPSDSMCYEIYGCSETYLTLRWVESGGFMIFTRQP